MSTIQSRRTSSRSSRANWMGQLVRHSPKAIRFRDLILPGSHHSASSSISSCLLLLPVTSIGRTQQLSVYQQLCFGIRYLDIRFAKSRSSTLLRKPTVTTSGCGFCICHGLLQGSDLLEVLLEIVDFVQTYPTEFVMVELVPEYGAHQHLSTTEKLQFLRLVKTVFYNHQFDGRRMPYLLHQASIQEITGTESTLSGSIVTKPRVCLLIHNRLFENESNSTVRLNDSLGLTPDYVLQEYGMATSQSWMHNPWHDTDDVEHLLSCNWKAVCQTHQLFRNLQFVLTPQVQGLSDVAAILLCRKAVRPLTLARMLYEKDCLLNFLKDLNLNKQSPPQGSKNCYWNILTLDYIDQCPDLIDYLIETNFQTL